MRLNLYWRGIDLIDVEVHLFRHRQDDEPAEQPPVLTAAAHPVDVSRAEAPVWADDQPAVVRFGFGFSGATPAAEMTPPTRIPSSFPRPR